MEALETMAPATSNYIIQKLQFICNFMGQKPSLMGQNLPSRMDMGLDLQKIKSNYHPSLIASKYLR